MEFQEFPLVPISKEHFEANMLDGDKVESCGGCTMSASAVWEYLQELGIPKERKVSLEEIEQCLVNLAWTHKKGFETKNTKAYETIEIKGELKELAQSILNLLNATEERKVSKRSKNG